jgi:poly(3-hydroxybutyrate) depolymerase
MSFGRLLLVCGVLAAALGASAGERGCFTLTHGGHELPLWHYRPAGLAADAPVLFVIHGVGRNAEDYLNEWVDLADVKQFLLVVPEFTKAQFPGEEAFNSGNLFDAQGRPVPREAWSFSMIEPAFDAVRARLGSTRSDYFIYGHSAGAQFVQRFLYFVPDARVSRAVAANAGWYMLPELGRAFPYGLQDTPADAAALRRAFAFPLDVLLGDADVDAKHPALRHTPEADEQGLHRFARGHFFFNHAKATAATMGAPFNWMLSIVPNVAHSNKGMAPFAARLLFPH